MVGTVEGLVGWRLWREGVVGEGGRATLALAFCDAIRFFVIVFPRESGKQPSRFVNEGTNESRLV